MFVVSCLLIVFLANDALSVEESVDIEDYITKTTEIPIQYQEIREPYFIYNCNMAEIKIKRKDIFEKCKPFDLEDLNPVTEINYQPMKEINDVLQRLKKKIINIDHFEYSLTLFSEKEKGVLEEIFWELIGVGKISLKDNRSGQVISEIIIEYFNYNPAPLWGRAGRIFRLPSGEIFKTKNDRYY